MQYHAHLYFELHQLEQARQLHQDLKSLGSKLVLISELLMEPRGPHPLPSFEIHFHSSHENSVLEFLKENHGSLSALIHPDTGDDHQDHSEGIRWLGKPLQLDFGFFDRIKIDPSLRINS